jgi:hypothetical protein
MSTEITVTDVTEGKLNGTGIFDKFTHSLREQLSDAVRNDDLNTSEFAEVMAASMPALFQQAVAFALGKDKAEADADLTRKQELKVDAEIEGIKKNNQLIDKQILKMDEEIIHMKKQNELIDQEILTAAVQRAKLEKETVRS